MNCTCSERYLDANNIVQRFPDTLYSHLHNCDYIRKRSELVPVATIRADAVILKFKKFEDKTPKSSKTEELNQIWNVTFAKEMERLVKENGL